MTPIIPNPLTDRHQNNKICIGDGYQHTKFHSNQISGFIDNSSGKYTHSFSHFYWMAYLQTLQWRQKITVNRH